MQHLKFVENEKGLGNCAKTDTANYHFQQEFSEQSSNCQQQYEHKRMINEDYEGLFYRKLNYIIELQQNQQAFMEREQLMSINQSSNDPKLGEETFRNSRSNIKNEHAVVTLTKQMISYQEKTRKMFKIKKQKAEIQVKIDRFSLDKKILIEEIRVFLQKLGNIAQESLADRKCRVIENILVDHGRKYNLSSSIAKFILQIKTIVAHNLVYQCLKVICKRLGHDPHSILRSEQLKTPYTQSKSLKQTVGHLVLYLRQFQGSNICRQLSEIITKLVQNYESIKLGNEYLQNKLIEQIGQNLTTLSKINKQIVNQNNTLKDYKIEIEIMTEQNRLIQKNLWVYQKQVAEAIKEQTEGVLAEYQQNSLENCSKYPVNLSFEYFNSKIAEKYNLFLLSHLKQAEHIQAIKQKINLQSIQIEKIQKSLSLNSCSSSSQLLTHRSIYKSSKSYEKEDQLKVHEHDPVLTDISNKFYDSTRTNSFQEPRVIFNIQNDNKEMVMKFSNLLHLFEKKQRFLVKKMFGIGNKSPETKDQAIHKSSRCQKQRQYQLKITKKYLILLPLTEKALAFNQKIEVNKVINYSYDLNTYSIKLQYGTCSIILAFLTKNIDNFIKKLKSVIRTISKMQKEI